MGSRAGHQQQLVQRLPDAALGRAAPAGLPAIRGVRSHRRAHQRGCPLARGVCPSSHTARPPQVRIGQWAQMSEPAAAYDTRQTVTTLVHPKYDPADFAAGHDATLLLLDAPVARAPVRLPAFVRESAGWVGGWVGGRLAGLCSVLH